MMHHPHHRRKHWRPLGKLSKEMFKLPTSIKLVSLVVLVYFFGWGMLRGFSSLYFDSLFNDYGKVGMVMSFMYLGTIFWSLPLAGIIDKISEKRLIKWSLLLYIPMGWMYLKFATLGGLFMTRIYNSLTASLLWGGFHTYVRENSKGHKPEEAMGLFDTGYTISMILGPIVGGLILTKYFATHGFVIYYGISVFAFAAFILSFFLPDPDKDRESFVKSLKTLKNISYLKNEFHDFLSNKRLLKNVSFSSLYIFSNGLITMLLPLFLKELGASFLMIGITYAVLTLPYMAEFYFSTSKHKHQLILFALSFASLFFILIFFIEGMPGYRIPALFILSFLISICFAAIRPILTGQATKFMPKKKIGELTVLYTMSRDVVAGLSFFISGFLAKFFGLNFVFLIGGLGLMVLFFGTYFRKITF